MWTCPDLALLEPQLDKVQADLTQTWPKARLKLDSDLLGSDLFGLALTLAYLAQLRLRPTQIGLGSGCPRLNRPNLHELGQCYVLVGSC